MKHDVSARPVPSIPILTPTLDMPRFCRAVSQAANYCQVGGYVPSLRNSGMGPEDITHPIRESNFPCDGRDEYLLFKAKQKALTENPLSRSGLLPPRERQLESQSVIGSSGPVAPCKSKQCEV